MITDHIRLSDGTQLGVSGPTAGGTLRIGGRRTGWKSNREIDEVEAARRFSSFAKRGWLRFEKQPQNSDIDVKASSEDGNPSEGYQVTVLYDQDFWRSVNTTGSADIELTREDVTRLIQSAFLKKKDRYPLAQRPLAILLIDFVPGGMLESFAAHTRRALDALLEEAAFKEVWLVGSTADQLFPLWPR